MLKEPLLKALARLLTVAQASMSLNRNRQRSFLVIVPFCWDETIHVERKVLQCYSLHSKVMYPYLFFMHKKLLTTHCLKILNTIMLLWLSIKLLYTEKFFLLTTSATKSCRISLRVGDTS